MNEDLKTGIAIALCSRGRRFVKRKLVAVYNLLDFDGYYYKSYTNAGTGTGDFESSDFSAGEFPLVQTEVNYLGATNNNVAAGGTCYLRELPFLAGERVRIEVLFPETDFDALSYEYQTVSYTFRSGLFPLPDSMFEVMFTLGDQNLRQSSIGNVFSTYKLIPTVDQSDIVIGFVLEGVLETNLGRINMSQMAHNILENPKPITFSITTNYVDYNRLKITVYE